mgnify:CR=1 FL=1
MLFRSYLKVGDANRPAYEAAGMRPFKPHADRPMTMSYYQVPADVIEHADELAAWARAAIGVAEGGPTKKSGRRAARVRPSRRPRRRRR